MLTKSWKGVAIIAGSAGIIILVTLASFSLFPNPLSSSNNEVRTAANNQTSSIFYVDRCHERPALFIVDARGFETVKSMTVGLPTITQGTPVLDGPGNGAYEFVLRPGFTGYIFTTYDFCPDWTKTGDKMPIYHNSTKEIAELLNPMNYDVFRFKDKVPESENATNSDPLGMITPSEGPIARFGAVIPSENFTGVEISIPDIARIDDQSVKLTYFIIAGNNAERGTYGISFAGTCTGEILTIGDAPNENSMAVEMVKGPFYGCSS